jgi:hypothetical protein
LDFGGTIAQNTTKIAFLRDTGCVMLQKSSLFQHSRSQIRYFADQRNLSRYQRTGALLTTEFQRKFRGAKNPKSGPAAGLPDALAFRLGEPPKISCVATSGILDIGVDVIGVVIGPARRHQYLRLAAAGCRLVKFFGESGQTFDPDTRN